VVSSERGRLIHQSLVGEPHSGRQMLLRVVIEVDEDRLFVVTAYKTSKIEKYWRSEIEP
jgi:hypothetical protein